MMAMNNYWLSEYSSPDDEEKPDDAAVANTMKTYEGQEDEEEGEEDETWGANQAAEYTK